MGEIRRRDPAERGESGGKEAHPEGQGGAPLPEGDGARELAGHHHRRLPAEARPEVARGRLAAVDDQLGAAVGHDELLVGAVLLELPDRLDQRSQRGRLRCPLPVAKAGRGRRCDGLLAVHAITLAIP
jgi:hypothetical protein